MLNDKYEDTVQEWQGADMYVETVVENRGNYSMQLNEQAKKQGNYIMQSYQQR